MTENMAENNLDEAVEYEGSYVSPDVAAAQDGQTVVFDMTLPDVGAVEPTDTEVFPNDDTEVVAPTTED